MYTTELLIVNPVNLFCFPYAGGFAAAFSQWKQHLIPNIALRPVELAGRGRRIREKLYTDLPEAIEDVLQIIEGELKEAPYALFGHSMGGLIVYELARTIRQRGLPPPMYLFFSGRGAPHVKQTDEKKFHLMEEQEFKEEVIKLGGTPPGFFDQAELLDLFLPLLKNDFRLAETVLPHTEIIPFDTGISVFLGKDDDLTPEQCMGWSRYTTRTCAIYYFEGGHFFLHNKTRQLVKIINSTLMDVLNHKAAV